MTTVVMNRVVKNFKFNSTDESITNFKDLRGKSIVLYFYPKDNTPGCTTEGQDFKKHYKKFLALNTLVLGVSRDTITSHEKFCDKFSFPFPLISDEDEALCHYFDVIKMKNMYGKQVRGIERSTFLINEDGKLIYEWRKVRVPGHVEAILAHLDS